MKNKKSNKKPFVKFERNLVSFNDGLTCVFMSAEMMEYLRGERVEFGLQQTSMSILVNQDKIAYGICRVNEFVAWCESGINIEPVDQVDDALKLIKDFYGRQEVAAVKECFGIDEEEGEDHE